MKHYTDLPPQEQKQFMTRVKEYANRGMLRINRLAQPYEMPLFYRGLEFIEVYGCSDEWLTDLRKTGNFLLNVTQLKEIINSIVAGTVAPSVTSLTPHRGRPTKAEQAARKAQEEEKRKEEEKNSLFRPTPTLPSEGGSSNSNDSAETIPSDFGNNLPSLSTGGAGGGSLHLDQLAFLMSEDLAKTVTNGNIRTMRRQFEDAYSQAKDLAEQGKEEEAATQAQLAHDLNEQIEAIYQQVDEELAAAYIRLKEDDPYIAEITAKVKDLKEVIAIVRPYHKKVSEAQPDFDEKVRAKIKENSPEAVAAREAKKATHDKAAAIIKYLRRTDKPNTDKRIATMRKKLDELHELIGAEADAYEPLLQKAMEDNKQ